MVFGISTSPPKELSDDLMVESEIDFLQVPDKEVKEDSTEAKGNTDTKQPQFKEAAELEENQNLEKDAKKEEDDDYEDDDDDDNDDDDISIIISSDATASPVRNKNSKRHSKPRRLYNRRLNLTEYFGHIYQGSQNPSAISLDSNYRNYNNYRPSFSPMRQQPYARQTSRPGFPTRGNGFNGVQMPFPMAQHTSYPMQTMLPMGKGPNMLSGSQVMAQYLAKSQHDSFIYANSILANDVSPEEVIEYHRHTKRNPKKTDS